jgi:hypothetical protein
VTRWAAVLDEDIEGADLRTTRAAAERDAEWLRNHPARRDRVQYGHGGVVRVVLVRECEWTGEAIEVQP